MMVLFKAHLVIARCLFTVTDVKYLSDDPGKNCTIFYCSDAISFPHIETVVFLGQEFLNWWKTGLWNKMYLNSILKGSSLCV